jgi:NhaA family Na+:H+ antiporter
MVKRTIRLLQEFSLPLIAGVVVALIWANVFPETYHHFIEDDLFGHFSIHFLVNDIFMVFFFAIAGIEIVQSLKPGGDLNPISTAVNPLAATVGGVVGPIIVFITLNQLFGKPEFAHGWGIPTATDIAIAWLAAKFVFGELHPAVKFLLLIAVADDAIGMAIIAIFYPDPLVPVEPLQLMLVPLGIVVAYLLSRKKIANYWPYLILGGIPCWLGLYQAHLHPALALIFIVPFFPHPEREEGHLFETDSSSDSAMERFEQDWRLIIDFGLFFFGLANAGVQLSSISGVTWFVLLALIIGKTVGIFTLGTVIGWFGFPLPLGMGKKELFMAGFIAASGLTVALFVADTAFTDAGIQGAAKMGALLSGGVAITAVLLGKLLGIKRITAASKEEAKEEFVGI